MPPQRTYIPDTNFSRRMVLQYDLTTTQQRRKAK